MSKTSKIVASVLGALALATLVIGLTAFAYEGESTASAKQNFCDSLTELSDTVKSYQGLNPATATNDELDDAADDISDAYNDVVDEAYDWAYAEDNALTEAYDDLYEAIDDIPGDYTVSQSIEALESELSALPRAYDETFDGSGCSTT